MSGVVESVEGLRRFRPYPDYVVSESKWFDRVPKNWDLRRLKNLIDIPVTDGPHETPEFLSDGIPFLSVDGIQDGELVFEGCRFISKEDSDEYRRKCAPRRDDILLGKAASTGKIARVKVDFEFSVWSPLALIRPALEQIDPHYLEFALKSPETQAEIDVLCTSNTQKNIAMADIPKLTIAIPHLPEQRAIAEFLDRETGKIDALIANKERLIELLQEKRTALITHAVTRGLDPTAPTKPSGIDWLGDIPTHWETKRVKNVSRFVTSGSRGWAEHYADDGPIFLRIGNLNSKSIDLDLNDLQHVRPPFGAEGERTRVRSGDVLISITALIGAVGVVPDRVKEAYVNQHIALVRPPSTNVDSRWIAYCTLSSYGQEQFGMNLYGGTKDGLGLEDVRSLRLLWPPLGEQREIVRYLDDRSQRFESLICRVRDGITRFKEFRTALISAAVTGKIDVREEVA